MVNVYAVPKKDVQAGASKLQEVNWRVATEKHTPEGCVLFCIFFFSSVFYCLLASVGTRFGSAIRNTMNCKDDGDNDCD